MANTIQKQLAGHEDLLLGSGTVSQIRGDASQQIRRIEAAWIFRSNTEIRNLDTTRYTRVQLHTAGPTKEFWFDATSALADNDDTILRPASNPALGRWLDVNLGATAGSFVPLAGGTMTGPLLFNNDSANRQIQIYPAAASGQSAGYILYDYAGANAVTAHFSNGDGTGIDRIYSSGNFEFFNAQQALGFNRFVVFSSNGVNAKLVLGTPWTDGVGTPAGKTGYDHFQLVFKRDSQTTTPFQEAFNAGVRQYWISGKGEALFSGGLELARLPADGTFSYTAYSEAGSGVTGQTVFRPNRSLVSGSPSWFTGEFIIETSSTTDPVSNPGLYHQFKFASDGQFIAKGISLGASGKVGFFGKTPVVQVNSFGVTAGFTAGAGSAVLADSTFTGNIGATTVTISDIVATLKTYGLLPE